MELSSLFVALALTLLVAAFIARPLIERLNDKSDMAEAADALIAQREAVLTELRDLDFDHATGKVGEADYAEQRARLVAKGAVILQELAGRTSAPASPGNHAVEPRSSAQDTLDDEIEQLIAARRAARHQAVAQTPLPVAPDPLTPTCPHCAARIVPGDRFCAKCGTKLMTTPEAA